MLPKITNEMFRPISIVLMNLDGEPLKSAIIRALPEPFSFNNSMRSLLAETNAVSMPEKNAISKSAAKMANSSMAVRK